MSQRKEVQKLDTALETAKAAARLLNGSSSEWVDAENKALHPMAKPLAEYAELRALAEAKRAAAETLLAALDELDK